MTVSEPKRKITPRDWNGDPRELIALLRFMSGEQREGIETKAFSADDIALARDLGIDLE